MSRLPKDYYEILELEPGSGKSDILKAYRRLAKRYHPDVNKSKDAAEKFVEISEAYEFLVENIDVHTDEHVYNDYRESAEYQEFREEVRKRAQNQAKMRYEEFRKKHEAFRESGIDDVFLIFKILFHIILIPLSLFLTFFPVYLAIIHEWSLIFISIFSWPFAGIIFWYIRDNKANYFMPGEFFYSPKKIKLIFTQHRETNENCYYCKAEKADSKPGKIELLKLKEIKLQSSGFRQHKANYINESVSIVIPRSRKAFLVHTSITLIKVLSIIFFIALSGISSILWRFLLGLMVGGILSSLVLLITGTRSNVSVLLSYNSLFRLIIWLGIIFMGSTFTFSDFDITTTDFIHFIIASIVLFDSFLMQFSDFLFGKGSSKPLIHQHPEVNRRFEEGYRLYNDVSVVSAVYPLFKWIFG